MDGAHFLALAPIPCRSLMMPMASEPKAEATDCIHDVDGREYAKLMLGFVGETNDGARTAALHRQMCSRRSNVNHSRQDGLAMHRLTHRDAAETIQPLGKWSGKPVGMCCTTRMGTGISARKNRENILQGLWTTRSRCPKATMAGEQSDASRIGMATPGEAFARTMRGL